MPELKYEIVKECGSSIPYLFVVDFDNDTDGYKVVYYFIPKDGNRYDQSLKEIFVIYWLIYVNIQMN